MDKLLEVSDHAGFAERAEESKARGKLRGFGIAHYIEACGIAPSNLVGQLGARAGLYESATVRVNATGSISVYTGSHSHGQGHETTFAQVVADMLGMPENQIDIVHGDTNRVPFGMGTYGSRSLAVGGSAIVKSVDKIVAKAKKIAAHQFEANPDDVVYEDGTFSVAGSPSTSVHIAELGFAAFTAHDLPEGLEPNLQEQVTFDPINFAFPFGTHVAVVEVDTDTGYTELKKYVAVDDCGNQVNPLIVEGQVHGGVVQGAAQALWEHAIYDADGNPTNPSLLDYLVPSAAEVPTIETDFTVTPSTSNPLGVKGVGEAGTIGSAAAVINAVCDALSPLGIHDIEMPATPWKVRTLIAEAEGAQQ
jgi:carbon-monoxide dehydrogenase large subunit